jgi:hypothetical protein
MTAKRCPLASLPIAIWSSPGGKDFPKKGNLFPDSLLAGGLQLTRHTMQRDEHNEAAEHRDKVEALKMDETDVQINFDAPAVLRKWPSIKNERVGPADGGRPYLIIDGTLDDCIRQFMAKSVSQRHLYEIYTTPQGELISAVLSAEQIVELARLRDFL